MNVREPVMSEHARKVLAWRESFLKMEENRFFEIMRMYLGEIKTPYNKQKLIMNLEGFFRKKENLINIKSFLSEDDIKLICAIVFIPDATENKLTSTDGIKAKITIDSDWTGSCKLIYRYDGRDLKERTVTIKQKIQ